MPKENSLNRREFIGKTAMLSSALTLAGGATKVHSQLNNSAVPAPSRIGVGVIGVGVRGTELMQASMKINGVEVVAACDLYKGHLVRAQELAGDPTVHHRHV